MKTLFCVALLALSGCDVAPHPWEYVTPSDGCHWILVANKAVARPIYNLVAIKPVVRDGKQLCDEVRDPDIARDR